MAIVMIVSFVTAQEKAQKGDEAKSEMQKEMEMIMKAGMPGIHHQHLQQFVGTWNATVKNWMSPDAPPQVSTGIAESKMILEGRFLMMDFKSEFMKQPFTGVGIQGYDNVKNEYVGIWMDNMTSGMMISTGKCEQDGKVFTSYSVTMNPVTKKNEKSKSVTRIIDKDKHIDEMFMIGPDGKEFKNMEITYIRKK